LKLARTDWLLAFALCVLLQTVWVVRDWANLSALHLPDTDDMMRLQQIRDWLGGQSWFDLTQHRMGLRPDGGTGLPMHWTRVNDLLPALIMVMTKPVAGTYGAELAAVIIAPAALFFTFLALSARAALHLGGPSATKTAILIAALAFPAAGMFIPGRIDHHALQIILLLAGVTAAIGVASVWNGALVGTSFGLSVAVGLEAVPQIVAALCAIMAAGAGSPDRRNFNGMVFAAITVVGTLSTMFFIPHTPGPATCDSFNQPIATVLQMGALAALFFFTGTSKASGWKMGELGLGGLAVLVIMLSFFSHPECRLGPYGQIDPMLRRVWLGHVGEAQGIFDQPHPAIILGYGILVCAATAAAAWFAWKLPAKRNIYVIFAAPLVMSLVVMLFQLRGAYIGAGLAAPVMAQFIGTARAKGTIALAGAWFLSAGILHHMIADDLDTRMAAAEQGEVVANGQSGAGCTSPASMMLLNTLPPSRIMAPMDAGAYIVGATHHIVYAGPYHRNNGGNLAMYRFFLSAPAAARAQAMAHKADFVFLCPESLSELEHEPQLPTSLVALLKSGHTPIWLEAVPLRGTRALLFKVRNR
jgi:hypothetical protein